MNFNLKTKLLGLCILLSGNIFAQAPVGFDFSKQLWTGLRVPQPEHELPKGNAPFQTAVRVQKTKIPTQLEKINKNEWVFKNGWELADEEDILFTLNQLFDPSFDTSKWYNATVPGTVLTTLVNQGVYPDPYYGLNNMNIPESLARTNWWYRTVFKLPKHLEEDNLLLEFNGINYAADVYLNGKKLGSMKGAFKRGVFNITDIVNKTGENVLAVRVAPPTNPGIPHEQSIVAGQGLNGGNLSEDGPTFISSIGWDWIPGIRDRNTGIWQDVLLKNVGNLMIGDPLVSATINLPDTTYGQVTIMAPVKNLTNKVQSGELIASFDGRKISKEIRLQPNEEKEITLSPDEFKQLDIKNPRLWWPNGYGKQNLYNLDLTVDINGKLSDTKKTRFGIRELSYEMMIADRQDSTKFMRVLFTPTKMKDQGKPVFDYVNRVKYDDNISVPTLREGIDLKNSGGFEILDINDPVGPYLVLRVNGERIFAKGGNWGMDDGMKRVSREKLEPYFKLHKDENLNIIRNWTGESTEEDFYALADEYGMLVWNDFWMTTDDTVEPQDFVLFTDNARDAVKRFRNHPSIAIWIPRNEGYAPEELSYMLEDAVAKEDPTRHYHGQSRFLNMGTSGPWGHFDNPVDYYTNNAKGFNTELGTYAIPTVETIEKFVAPEDQWPINDVWAYHDLHHTTQNFDGFMKDVERYGKPNSMPQFVKQAHLVNYDAWRAMLEAWNSKMWNNTTGLVLWMSHPAWPSFIWQTYTYDYETPASYFGTKKAAEPVHIQLNLDDYKVIAVNTSRKPIAKATATIEYINMNGKVFSQESKTVNLKANGTTYCLTAKEMKDAKEMPQMYLVRLTLKANNKLLSINDYWMTDGKDISYLAMNEIPQVKIEVRKEGKNKEGKSLIIVKNPSQNIAVAIKLNAINKETKETILPAYFSDGYFNLLPGESRIIELELPEHSTDNIDIKASGYNIAK